MINLGYHEFYPKEFLQIFTTNFSCLDPLKSFASKIRTYLGYHEFDTNGASSNLHNKIFIVGTQFFFQLKEEEDYKSIIIYLISNGILAT